MSDSTRHSQAAEAELIQDPEALARQESYNVIQQFRAVADMVESYLHPDRPFKLRPPSTCLLISSWRNEPHLFWLRYPGTASAHQQFFLVPEHKR